MPWHGTASFSSKAKAVITVSCLVSETHLIMMFDVARHSYVLSVYCFTLVLSSLSSFHFFVYCVLCSAAGIGEINFLNAATHASFQSRFTRT